MLSCVTGLGGANPGPLDPGRSSTLGAGSGGAIPGLRHNPAAAVMTLQPDERFKSSVLNILNFGVEAGDVDDFVERIEVLGNCLEEQVTGDCTDSQGNVIRPIGDDDISIQEGLALEQEFNDALEAIGRDGYVLLDTQIQLPSMPLVFRAGPGVIGLDIHGAGLAQASVLDDSLRFNPITESIETDTAAYIRTARFVNLGLSYAQDLAPQLSSMLEGSELLGQWAFGARLTLMQGTMARVVAAVDSEDDNGQDAFDRAEDAYDQAERETTTIALDLGFMWNYERYAAGLTLRNLNSPSFDYNPLGEDCGSILNPGEQADCLVAATFADRLDGQDVYEAEPQVMLEGRLGFLDNQLRLSTQLELNSVESPVGLDYQWWNLGLEYAPSLQWIPSLRAGYRNNLASGGVDALALGLTLFGVINLDVARSTDSVVVDGSELPRYAAVSLGFEMPL